MTPDDDQREATFFNSMTMRERLLRFLGMKNQLLPEEVRQLTHLDFDRDFALVAVDRSTDSLAGIARYCRDAAEPEVAEVAVAVLQKYQRLGIARYLVSAIFSAAKEHGVRTLVADILRENSASRQLFDKVAKEAGAKKELKEADFELYTFHYTFPDAQVEKVEKSPQEATPCGATPFGASEREYLTPRSHVEGSEQSPPAYTVDDSRHPRSLWRHDVVYESGLRLHVRPADPDDDVRIRHFAKKLDDAGDPASMDKLMRIDFTNGFHLIALDTAKDEFVGAAHFHRGSDSFSLNVLVDPEYRGLGVGDFLTQQVMRAADKEVVQMVKSG